MNSSVKSIDRYVLIALIVLEALACYNFYSREIAWYPPGNYDQTYYLAEAYRTKERILTNGIGQLVSVLRSHYNNGLALPILGALSGLLFTGGRFPELFVSFAVFVLLQIAAYMTGQAVWRSRTYGYMLLGLVLCQNTPWYWAGGLFDFRFDFIAYCLYGIWVCAILRSELFMQRGWAIAAGLIGAFLVLNRFIALVYIVGISAGLFAVCIAILFLRRRDRDLKQRMSVRLQNGLLSVGIVVFIAGPFLVNSREEIFDYYGVGHFLSGIKEAYVRQQALSLRDFLLFYPDSILRDHWGVAFCVGVAIILIGGLLVVLRRPRRAQETKALFHDEEFVLQICFLIGTVVGPVLVLSMDAEKNSVVGGIIGVPAALFFLALSARLSNVRSVDRLVVPKTVSVCSLVVFLLGVGTVFERLGRHLPEYNQRADLTRLVELNKWMANYASVHGWSDPGFSVDAISPWLNGYGITDSFYEQTGKYIEFHPMLGRGPGVVDRQEALSELSQSQFFLLTNLTSPETGGELDEGSLAKSGDPNYQCFSVLRRLNPHFNPIVQLPPTGIFLEASSASLQRWPASRKHLYTFYEGLAQYRDDLKAWADKNMVLAQTVAFENFTVTVYVSPGGPGSGLSDNAH
jgi:hypothetical protein